MVVLLLWMRRDFTVHHRMLKGQTGLTCTFAQRTDWLKWIHPDSDTCNPKVFMCRAHQRFLQWPWDSWFNCLILFLSRLFRNIFKAFNRTRNESQHCKHWFEEHLKKSKVQDCTKCILRDWKSMKAKIAMKLLKYAIYVMFSTRY